MLIRLARVFLLSSILAVTVTGCNDDDSNTNDVGDSGHTSWSNGSAIVNPGIGFTDFHSYSVYNDQYSPEPSYPETSVIYFRFYWEDIEPVEGEFHTEQIEEVFEKAKALDKKVVLRFMTLADSYSYHVGTPCWVKVRVETQPSGDTAQNCTMDKLTAREMYKDPEFKQLAENFLHRMSSEFGDRDELLRIDVGMVGSWGEWHLAGWGLGNPNLGSEDIGLTNDDLKPYVDMVDNAFPNTHKNMLIASELEDMLSYATSKGMGWRADCLGDWLGGEWSHMASGYPSAIRHAKGEGSVDNEYPDPEFDERWKTAPVDFEICWNSLEEWKYKLTDEQVLASFEWALEQHASLINAKSHPIPDEYQTLVQDVLSKLGYQFELTALEVEENLAKGQAYSVTSHWINKGVAPSYLDYPIMFRLRDSSDSVIATFSTDVDIKKWMPADELEGVPEEFIESNEIVIPSDINSGTYSLDIGLVEPGTETAKIQLRNQGVRSDRWYEVKTVNIN